MCVQVDVLSCMVFVHSWVGRGVIDLPLREVAEFMKPTENAISWDKYLVVRTS